MSQDIHYMQLALDLAAKGRGRTSPNPMVGAVLVKDGRIVGSGYHKKAGSDHAEIMALKDSGDRAYGSTLYVTLEPCSHAGRTPPCTESIIAAGVKKVVTAMTDPNPLVNGKGLTKLRNAGIEVKNSILEKKARRLNEAFIKYITTSQPFAVLKTAMTLDGKIAAHTGASRWITNERSREQVHRLRNDCDALMVGVGTVLADNPRLTTRLPEGGHSPLRVIVDSMAKTPLTAVVVKENPENTLIVTTSCAPERNIEMLIRQGVGILTLPPNSQHRVPLEKLMDELGRRKVTSVLVEGGSTLNFSLLEAGLVDKVHFFIAPIVLGGGSAPTPVGGKGLSAVEDAWGVSDVEITRYENDLLVTGYIQKKQY